MRPTVQTRAGGLRGIEEDGVLAFRGVPYAAATSGAGRFRGPGDVVSWSGVREAARSGPAAIQTVGLPSWLRRFSAVPRVGVSEDCLNLNVWTPGVDSRRRPVLVWIHGGGFTRGSGSWYLYSGARMARRGDVVVVGINYRLGVLGALATGEMKDGHSGDSNVGLRDQIAALRWVEMNISDFGGDPEQVTVFGQSAGAMSIASLVSSPRARPLIRRAILQSGAASNVLTLGQAESVTRRLCAAMEIDVESAHPLAQLRGRPADELLAAQLRVSAENPLPLGTMSWQPSLDGDVLPHVPIEAWENPESPRPQLLLGGNLDEWRMFTATDAKRRKLDDATLRSYLERTLSDRVDVAKAVDSALEIYGRTGRGEPRSPGQIWADLQGDRVFHSPAAELADRSAECGAETWFYRFDWKPPRAPERLGACHSMELPFVFGSVRGLLPRWFLGARAEAFRLSDRLQDAWLAFAKTGDPRTESDSQWPRYVSQSGECRVFGGSENVVPALTPERREFWRGNENP